MRVRKSYRMSLSLDPVMIKVMGGGLSEGVSCEMGLLVARVADIRPAAGSISKTTCF